MKLTDEQIIESFIEVVEFYKNCGFKKFEALKDVLDLINRQKAEIERLNFTIEGDRARHNSKLSDRRYACGVLWDSLEKETEDNRRLQAVINQLGKECDDLIEERNLLFDVAERRLNEIEELNIKLNAIIKPFVPESAENAIQTIRVDVIKDFAEKLKANFCGRNTLRNAMVHAKIDNLVKEMVGE